MTAKLIIFYCLAVAILFSSVMAVVSKKMLRAATFLLIVLISTAGLYLLLDYQFLAVVQLSVYAGGILVLFIFAILLTSAKGDRQERHDSRRILSGSLTALAGIVITTFVTMKHRFLYAVPTPGDNNVDMKEIGHALLGTGKNQYLLSFEALSILLLVCIVGGILIARKR